MDLNELKKVIKHLENKLEKTYANMLKYHTAEWTALWKHGPDSTQHTLAAQKLQAKQDWIEQTEAWLAEARETVNNGGNLIFN